MPGGLMLADRTGPASRNSAGSLRAIESLLILLSVIAGSTDIIGFLSLDGLFTSHVTGNWALLAAHLITGSQVQIAKILSVPAFIAAVVVAVVFAGGLRSIGIAPLRPLLFLQFLLLSAFLIACVAAGPHINATATSSIPAALLGVSAMATQNALVQVSLKGMPATAVMTSNVTRFAVDVGTALSGDDPTEVAAARKRAGRTLLVIVGFAFGCGLGAALEAAFGPWSLALPAALALCAFAIGFLVESEQRQTLAI